jgi:hypothetical protein
MRSRVFHSTGFASYCQNAFNHSTVNNLLKRCLYQLRRNVLPTLFILICSSVIILFLSELIYRAKHHSTSLKPAQASHARPANAQI